ncbi:MAG TPA: saccharopine dehydrogenase NADP-binding domain-containing protein [Pseudonocardiaceae bacterium]|nr:saccharopine dehydrogenase NADP-binding domain-containing protein [Pseudonocardiaceae bacterium]
MADRDYDIVVFGATGFTGGLTAEYLARNAPADLRWALAGRSEAKLAFVRDKLAAINPASAHVGLLVADVDDAESLRAVAESTRVVITTVGPYLRYGEPLVAACAAAGTDYVDLCGEPEFYHRMYLRYHALAERTGARIVHACGFDSIPADLGAYFTVRQLPNDRPITVESYLRISGTPSGGTLASALTAFSRGRQNFQAARDRRRAEPELVGRKVHIPMGRPGHNAAQNAWVVPLPVLDPQIVAASATASEKYGPDFTYQQFLALRQLTSLVGLGIGVVGLVGAAQIPPLRQWISDRVKPGEGPSANKRAKSWFRLRFVGRSGDTHVVTEVAGGDPGYDESAKMLAESALCLAIDELPKTAGQVTTATAMGDALITRLNNAGITFTTITS